jgi:lambda family phage portal protein
MAKRKKPNTTTQTVATTTNKETRNNNQRSFAAAVRNRFTSDWGELNSLNVSNQLGLSLLRARARDLSVNNEYARRYLKLIKNDVVGPDGIQISVQANNPDGTYDRISDRIEEHFWKWSQPENCSVTGQMDFRKIQELVLESIARDGEVLVWFRRGIEFGPYSFQLQILDADHLDENYNAIAPNGNRIVQGVELNQFGKPVAYWIWVNNPTDTQYIHSHNNKRIRVETQDLKHIFDPERASQVRGFSWLAPAMTALQHISKFRESTLVNARLAAGRQLFYKQGDSDAYDDADIDDLGNITLETNPGAHEILPRGWEVEKVDWNAPTDKLGDFQKHVLRGVAAALGVSYNSLAVDLESVNYSSARFGALQDQSMYRSYQQFFINMFVKPVYETFLEMQLLTNFWGLNIPASRFDKFANVVYRPRSWSSVDPGKDASADITLLQNNLTSYTDVINKRGGDPEAVFAQIAKDREMMAKYGITPKDVIESLQMQQGQQPDSEE